MTSVITSSANPLFKRIRALAAGRTSKGEAAFYCEGVQPVWRAVERQAHLEMLVVAPELLAGSPAERLVSEQEEQGATIVRLSAELFRRISDRDGPSGLAAVVRGRALRLDDLDDLVARQDAVFVVLHEVANPGNLGSILRTADAAGAAAVILTGNTADPFTAAAARASMGSIFSVGVAREPTLVRAVDWARQHGVHVLTTSAHASRSYLAEEAPRPLAIVFGNEGTGLRPAELALGDESVRIPMVGSASSLNLSVAVGVVLFEVQRGVLEPPA